MAGLLGLLGGAGAALGPGIGMLGAGLPIFGSLFNANQQRHASDFYRNEGDPYRSQLRAITANPDLYFKGPIAASLANAADRRYSAIGGNPAGSGTGQALSLEAMLKGYGDERTRLASMGGLSNINAGIVPGRNAQSAANMGVFGSLLDLLGGITGLPMGGGGGRETGAGEDFGLTGFE